MKSITKITSACIVIILLISCEDFLDTRPEGTIPTSGLDYSKSENIFLPISAAYASLRNNSAHSFPYIGAFEITSDNADKGSTPEDNPPMLELDNFGYTPTNGLIRDLWVAYYDIVSAANYAIHQMPLFGQNLLLEDDREYAMQCQGEAKAIRAYAYFNLERLFGNIPLIDTLLTAEQLGEVLQSSPGEVYNFIEKDLEEAIQVLPERYSKEWAGRITRYTAMGLKAKVHFYQQEWDSVVSLSDRIILSNQFELLEDFREVFSVDGENSSESLFEIQSSTLGRTIGDITYVEYAYVQGPRGNSPGNMQGWGFCTPSANLISFYEGRNETIRPATTLLYRGTLTPEGDSIMAICTNPVYNGKVYTPSDYNIWNFNGYGFEHNVRVLRYSDVLLMYAEALVAGATFPAENGLTAGDAVNLVRERAGLDELSGVTLNDIHDERRAELALEEDRFFDLVRTGKAAAALAGKGFIAGKNEVFPIPLSQVQLNSNLVQNAGYNN